MSIPSIRSTIAVLASLATLALVSGCGGDDTDDDTGSAPSTSAPAVEETTGDGPAETEAPAGDAAVLLATLGDASDPDAFVITLTDESGKPVTSLPAGDYSIQVSDPSTIHNFHLTGGSVDETTTVDEITEVTWEVTLEAGDYRFVCDPHPNMVGEFTVT